MCGIAGELRFDGASADLAAVTRMSARMARRGPDGSGVWQRGSVALAHRRLTIIDLSRAGEQPMVDPELGLLSTSGTTTTATSAAGECSDRSRWAGPSAARSP
jgi:asparagine synthase (glutamine-hydrolysing)